MDEGINMKKNIKKLAEKKFSEAISMLNKCGEHPMNYPLSFVWGWMDVSCLEKYVHDFEGKRVTVILSDYEEEELPDNVVQLVHDAKARGN